MIRTRFPLAVVLTLSTLTAVGCKKEEVPPADSAAAAPAPPPAAAVTTIETGKHIDASKRIVDTASTFAPRDTMYVSVVTTNATPTTTLKSIVTHESGQVVDSSTQVVAMPATTGGTSVTEFHLVKPSGWPVGSYTVEIWLDGQSAGTRTLTVKR
ncbi:MAG TPA: hypothetical protein VF128_02480 [Gemmatimonadaceae bacterium]